MTFEILKQLLIDADNNGTLLTQKHDPSLMATICKPFRSVLSHDLASNLSNFITSDDYTVYEYENINYPLSPLYFTLTPNQGSGFDIPASGVTVTVATSTLDTLVVVSGGTLGIHMYGESSSNINTMIAGNQLIPKSQIK
jgi:hypothetical protein